MHPHTVLNDNLNNSNNSFNHERFRPHERACQLGTNNPLYDQENRRPLNSKL